MEVRELENGDIGKYTLNGGIGYDTKSENNKITVDKNNFQHSFNDQPAFIYYFKSGKIESEWWMNHGYEHRLTGPAMIEYWDNDDLIISHYYLYGNLLTKEQWETEVNRIKMLNEI